MIYLFVSIYTLLFTWLALNTSNKTARKILIVISVVFPIIIAGFRFNNGADYLQYKNLYDRFINYGVFSSSTSTKSIEIGFQWILRICSLFTTDSIYYFFLISLITIGLFYYGIWKESNNILFSITLFFISGIYLDTFNAVRQYLAVSIIFISVKYLINKEFVKYMIIVLIASLFHYSAIIMILVYPLFNIRLSFLKVICLIGLMFSMGGILFSFIIDVMNKTRYGYLINSNFDAPAATTSSIIAISYMSILVIIIYYYYYKCRKTIFDRRYFTLQIIIWMTTLSSYFIPLSYRLQYYFVPLEIIVIPYFVQKVSDKSIRAIMITSIVIMYLTITSIGIIYKGWYTCLPYNFYFNL